MTRIAPIGLALAIAVACTVNNNPGDDDPDNGSNMGSGSGSNMGSGSGSGSSGATISPSGGLWTYSETTRVSSTCQADVTHFEDGNFTIDQVAPPSFRIVPGDGTAPFACTSNGAQFSCPDRVTHVEDVPQRDAVITIRGTASGTLSDSTHGSGQQVATVDCVGTQCSVFNPLPCQFTVSFAIRKL
jgi:hypothetical protein